MRPLEGTAALRREFAKLIAVGPPAASEPEYSLGSAVGAGYAAISRAGAPSLVLPLRDRPGAVARAAGGCVLRPAPDVEFSYRGRQWHQPAAVIECTETAALDVFAVMALDIAVRADARGHEASWQYISELMEEWYRLLARRRALSPESEIGLWGELWVLSQASDPDRLVEAWVGPEDQSSDFVIGGVCFEVKTSRSRLRHHISQAQANRPDGEVRPVLLSLWVGPDPERGSTLPTLVDRVREGCADPAAFLRRLLDAGYSSLDQHLYQQQLTLLDEPRWFAGEAVPRIRLADPGVLSLRYMVQLDEIQAMSQEEVAPLRRTLLGHRRGSKRTEQRSGVRH